MSHGPTGDGFKAEPNLIPLLDLVFQLLMFFIVCVTFVTQQVNEKIKLPDMQSARPMDKRETDVLYLNLDAQGVLDVIGDDPKKRPSDILRYLTNQYDFARGMARELYKTDEVKKMVIIRADKSVEYKNVFDLLQLCKKAGFRKFQIRALTKTESR